MFRVDRRTVLRGAGVAMALPFLDVMSPATSSAAGSEQSEQRMVLIDLAFGLHAPNLFPHKSGSNYESTPYLDVVKDFRQDFTVISGLSHPSVNGGHIAYKSFLTSAPNPLSARFKNSISVDQLVAEKIGSKTRYSSLALSTMASRSSSIARNGVELPGESRPSRLFTKLFLDGTAAEKKLQVQQLKDGRSVLDAVSIAAKSMNDRISTADRSKLDQYFTSIRDVEQRLEKAEVWVQRPKTKATTPAPKDVTNPSDIINHAKILFEMIVLAFQSDSTRVITFHNACGSVVPPIPGVTQDYHNLTHHGQDPARIAELTIIEREQMLAFNEFLTRLQAIEVHGRSLLDQTIVMFGSALGNGSRHDNYNLPIILAGGGFRHGQHLAFNANQNVPLANLFVSMLQQMGLEIDAFGSSTGTLNGV